VGLVIAAEAPAITAGDLRAVQAQTDRIISAALVLTYQDHRWTLDRDDIARMVVFESGSGRAPQVALSPDALKDTFARIARDVEQPAQNARFQWAGGGNLRVVREGRDGMGLDLDALKVQMREHLLADERQISLPVAVTRPVVASSDGPKLGIKELIREGRTSFPGAVPEKQHNIQLASSRLHGTVVPPGATFSFNKEIGPTTLDAGFRTGWGITLSGSGARTIPSVAGGICQVATTLFHPVFHAGYSIEERHYHLYWIQSYGQPPLGMQGLDATVDEDYGLDLQFINTTSDYLLIQSRVEGSTLIFGLYGTKPTWKVQIEGPIITNVIPADRSPVSQSEASMPAGRTLQVEAAQDGFDATIVRTVTQGEDSRTLRLRSHYVPSHNVVLEGTGGP
jgi:vancomycin resistance protein YoaR